MNTIDFTIFSSFLLINLLIGLFYSKGVKNIRDYAIGDRNFRTSSIAATITATSIGAGFFSWTLTETYRQGLYFMIPAVCESLGLMLIGHFYCHRMGEFLGKLSIAQAMGDLFGKKVKLLTICIGIFVSIGTLGIQFKVAAKILELIFGASGTYATIFSASIVILYSTFGGIKAVTFTDMVQFIAFGVVIPIIAIIIWSAINDGSVVVDTLNNNASFDFKEVFDLKNPKFYQMICLIVIFLPGFEPIIFQRVAMSNSTNQAAASFKIAGLICLTIQLIVVFIGIFLLSDKPGLDPDNLINYIINHYTYPGFKGLFAVGIMAMIMSSADSLINSMSVIFAHDLCKPLNFKWTKQELLVSRIFAVFSGIVAMFFALKFNSILDLLLAGAGTQMSMISVPFTLAIFGFRSSGKSVLIGMIAGGITFITWQLELYKLISISIEGCLIAILVNIICLFTSHYVLKQPGGWVGIQDKKSFENHILEKRKNRRKFIDSIVNFKFLDFCKNNTPENDNVYCYFGIFAALSTLITTFTIPSSAFTQHYDLIFFLSQSILIISAYFFTYPIWPTIFKNQTVLSIAWIFAPFYILVCASTIFLILSNLAVTQLMLFFTNMLLVSVIFRWKTALLMTFSGFTICIFSIQQYTSIDSNIANSELQIMLAILLSSSVLIAFLKPAQQIFEKTNKLFIDAENKIKNMSGEMLNLIQSKQEFINNISHEIRTPMHHIGVGSHAIHNEWDKYNDAEKRDFAAIIYHGYQNAIGYINNILDFSSLSTNKVNLNFQKADFGKILEKALEEFSELHKLNNNLQFDVSVDAQNLMLVCDVNHIKQVINNLIQNAVKFSQSGIIQITITNEKLDHKTDAIKFAISDTGISIPENELHNIFGPFIQSSYTKKISEGKGLGLAVCERIVLLHHGKIWAKNNFPNPGSTFFFTIPLDF